ncbi:MAG: lipase [Bacteroidales bacterium]|nr:lipase [Candidatus Physcousia equi]
MNDHTKWVACWGNATSITDRKEAVYAKDITLRYPLTLCFGGSALRMRFSNLTGTEPVTLSKVSVMLHAQHLPLTFGSQRSLTLQPGQEAESDVLPCSVELGDVLELSIYLADYTQMNAGTLITGPLSRGSYSYGDFCEADCLPLERTRHTNWFYFLNTVDILTRPDHHALVCYGDSITAQSWPDCLSRQVAQAGINSVSIIRRAVSGTRILRQYDCITYQAYGLKGATRFPIEMNVAGASTVLIQHGINDIIHPVGVDVNPFRPWSDMPSLDALQQGVEQLYVAHARKLGLQVWSGTLLPIEGWRTYSEERDQLRCAFNEWLRQSPLFDRCVDFDLAVRNPHRPTAFAPGFDSGDHLHPSEAAYEAMAAAVLRHLIDASR